MGDQARLARRTIEVMVRQAEMRSPKKMMSRNWRTFVGGHLTQLGTRNQIQALIDYTKDALAIAIDVY